MWPGSVSPVRPAPPAAAAGAAVARASLKPAGISPFAMLPIATLVVAATAAEPGFAPFAWSKNAARFRYVWPPRLPGAAGAGGMAALMNATRSCVVRPLQLRMKSAPARGLASFEPRRSGMWQPAQFATYDE